MRLSGAWRLALACALMGSLVQAAVVARAQAPQASTGTLPAQPVRQEQRLALVIGNGAYKEAPLRNAVNDARAVAAALKEAGFTVMLRTDADHRSMQAAARDFGDQLRKSGGVGVFYYAGHGMQIRGRNYLVPVGADIQREDEVAYNALDAQAVLDKMDAAGNGLNLMILDACRNNPFARSFRSSVQGLAQMEAPVGTLVAFATAPGAVASDGTEANGLYTQHLLTAMRQPGVKIEDVFKQVRAAVRRDSQGKQIPWESTSLEGDLYLFAPAAAPAASPAQTTQGDPRDQRTTELLAELARPVPVNRLRIAAVAQPASNAQGYTVGDRWNYQVIDRWRGEVIRNYAFGVRSINADGSWVGAPGTHYDEQGRPIEYPAADGARRRISPYLPRWWPGVKVGDRRPCNWTATTVLADGSQLVEQVKGESRVLGIETAKVPAGEFQAYRIECKAVATAVGRHGQGAITMTTWFVPELRAYVALDRESTWNGRLETREREELTSYTLVHSSGPK